MMIKLMMIVLIQCCILSSCSSSFGRLFQQQGFSVVWTMLGMGGEGGEGFEEVSKVKPRKMLKPINL